MFAGARSGAACILGGLVEATVLPVVNAAHYPATATAAAAVDDSAQTFVQQRSPQQLGFKGAAEIDDAGKTTGNKTLYYTATRCGNGTAPRENRYG